MGGGGNPTQKRQHGGGKRMMGRGKGSLKNKMDGIKLKLLGFKSAKR